MKELNTKNDILVAIGEVAGGVDAINDRLDKLNGSVAKNVDKLAAQDVLNAQSTLIHQQIIKDITEIKDGIKGDKTERDTAVKENRSSISKFIFGLLSGIILYLVYAVLKKYGV